ncbi:MAG: DEAD/DEAH box helicase family protein [Firmicutes bacterium]|nr:DEAD/DEAH box helicase family protein [Bacillota bacterium]
MADYQDGLVAIDIETSGLIPGRDEIIEVAAVKLSGGEPALEFHSLIRPMGELPRVITRITGLTSSDLEDAPEIEQVLPRFLDFVGGHTLIAHNSGFDLGFIQAKLGQKMTNPSLDTLELSRIVYPQAGSYRLAAITRWLGLESDNYHRALDDARLTARLFQKLDGQLKQWNPSLLNEINQIGRTFSWPLLDYFTHLEGYQTRRFFSLELNRPDSTQPAADQDEFFSPPRPGREEKYTETVEIPTDLLEGMIAPDGPCSQIFPDFEIRPQQLTMLQQVAEALNQDCHLLVEAGTGSGKSLAYLLPSVVWAMANRQRVVVSTHTLTLQQQLLEHDLPLLQTVLGLLADDEQHPIQEIISREKLANLKIALAKGRNNYLCLRRWYGLHPERNVYEPEQKSFFIRLLSWINQTSTGDSRELNLTDNQPWWHMVGSDAESCWGRKCPHFQDRCFFMRSRRQWEEADLIVANHALMLSDLNAESKVLPAYERLVIDEAHHLEDLASEHLGVQVGESAMMNFLRYLYHQGYSGPSGILANLRQEIDRGFWSQVPETGPNSEALLSPAADAVKECQRLAERFFSSLKQYINRQSGNTGYSRQYLRLLPGHRENSEWNQIEIALDNLAAGMRQLMSELEQLESRIPELEGEETWSGNRRELSARIILGRKLITNLEQVMALEQSGWVHWAEIEERGSGQLVYLKASPVEVEEYLNSLLFIPKKTVVLTSATITVENSFNYFIERVGLDRSEKKLSRLQLDSPFSFEKQALLYIPRGLPDPSRVGDEGFASAIAPILIDLVSMVKGRTLVLFTSNYLLRETYYRVKNALEEEDILVLGHNIDGGQSRLLEEFRETPRAVILGSSSLWEGVDIPGEALSCVVIVKLPFGTPNLPIVEARLESLERRNRNGFYSYTMPQAILRLKQGFGRLIRTQNDRGMVVIMDNRIIDKAYGRRFLRSLPVNHHLRGEFPAIRNRLRDWMGDAPKAVPETS